MNVPRHLARIVNQELDPAALRPAAGRDIAARPARLKRVLNHVAEQAVNGNEAVSMFREAKPDLLLMDINMPLKTGEEALEEIRAEFPGARVIMLTSVIESETVEKCLSLGAVGYIRKDSPVDEIKAIISDSLKSEGQ